MAPSRPGTSRRQLRVYLRPTAPLGAVSHVDALNPASGLDGDARPLNQLGQVHIVAAERQLLAAMNAGNQKAVCIAVRHRGAVEALSQLLEGDVAADGDEAAWCAWCGSFLVSVSSTCRQSQASRTTCARDVALALHHFQRLLKFAFVDQQPLVLNAGIDHHAVICPSHSEIRITDGVDDALAGRHAASRCSSRPTRERRSCRSRGCARPRGPCAPWPCRPPAAEQVGVVPILAHLKVRAAADRVAAIDREIAAAAPPDRPRSAGPSCSRPRRRDRDRRRRRAPASALLFRRCRLPPCRHRLVFPAFPPGALPALVLPLPLVLPPSLAPLTFAVVSLASRRRCSSTASGSNSSALNPFHDARSRLSRTMSLKSVPGRSGVSRAHAASGLKPALLASSAAAWPCRRCHCRRARSAARRRRSPGNRPSRRPTAWPMPAAAVRRDRAIRVAAASTVSRPSPIDKLLVGRPQLHDAGRAEHHAINLLGIGGQRDAVNAGRLAADRDHASARSSTGAGCRGQIRNSG